jgi:hypothetical protein
VLRDRVIHEPDRQHEPERHRHILQHGRYPRHTPGRFSAFRRRGVKPLYYSAPPVPRAAIP